jgi:hypothetical protein
MTNLCHNFSIFWREKYQIELSSSRSPADHPLTPDFLQEIAAYPKRGIEII